MYLLVLLILLEGSPVSIGYCCEGGLVEFQTQADCESKLKEEAERLGPEIQAELDSSGISDLSYMFQCQVQPQHEDPDARGHM